MDNNQQNNQMNQQGQQPNAQQFPMQQGGSQQNGQFGSMQNDLQSMQGMQMGNGQMNNNQPGMDPNASGQAQGQPGQQAQNGVQNGMPADPNNPLAAPNDQTMQNPEDQKKEEHKGTGPDVTKTDIENVVSNWTGIPITKLTEDESEKLLKLEDRIHQRLIDQSEAVKAVSEAVRRGRIGLASGNRPIASFIFLGPTGTGKTELAKTLAEILFGRDDAMVRLDMSEYMEKHEVAKLIGAPPGYVGYEEGGQLTEAVRAKPYSIVLLDEVEKAHPDVFNILLQLLEDGRLTDNKGNTISFKNTIVICTSNIGSSLITQMLADKDTKVQKTEEQEEKDFKELSTQVNEELRKFFRPELLNRYDDIVIFKPLRRQDMAKIAKLGLDKTAKLLKEQGYSLQVTQKGLAQIAQEGFDPIYGARPLRRLVQTSIENPIALAIISKQFAPGDTIVIDYDATAAQYVFKPGVKKVDPKDAEKDAAKGMTQDGQQAAGEGQQPGMSAPDSGQGNNAQNGQQPNNNQQYPDWVKQALSESGQTPPQDPSQGGAGMAQQMPGSDPSASSGQGPNAQQPGPSLVDQMTQHVEAPFDPLALVGTPPPGQPTDQIQQSGSNGTQMQRAD